MDYMNDGSLQNYLTKDFKNLKWRKIKIEILYYIIKGLNDIHENEIIHHAFHSGNILQRERYPYIADLGLSCTSSQTSSSNKNDICGVLPYIAPEVLKE